MKAVIVLLAGTVSPHSALAVVYSVNQLAVSGTQSIVFGSTFARRNATVIANPAVWQGVVPPSNYTNAQWIWS
jgi:hypothetical protein